MANDYQERALVGQIRINKIDRDTFIQKRDEGVLSRDELYFIVPKSNIDSVLEIPTGEGGGGSGIPDPTEKTEGQYLMFDGTEWVAADIPPIPTKTSDLTNDSNFVTHSEIDDTLEEHGLAIDGLADGISAIDEKIPTQASRSNQLADKAFVNSSIATNTGTFKGTFNSTSELPTTGVNPNDYAFVIDSDAAGNTLYKRYKYNGTAWAYEYTLNNSSFTAVQWATINGGPYAKDEDIPTKVSELENDAGYIANGLDTLSANFVEASRRVKTKWISSPTNSIGNFDTSVSTSFNWCASEGDAIEFLLGRNGAKFEILCEPSTSGLIKVGGGTGGNFYTKSADLDIRTKTIDIRTNYLKAYEGTTVDLSAATVIGLPNETRVSAMIDAAITSTLNEEF